MDDLVKRQTVIDALIEKFPYIDPMKIMWIISDLPSTQSELIHCGECAKCYQDTVYHDLWCDGRKVWKDHFCGYAERREDG